MSHVQLESTFGSHCTVELSYSYLVQLVGWLVGTVQLSVQVGTVQLLSVQFAVPLFEVVVPLFVVTVSLLVTVPLLVVLLLSVVVVPLLIVLLLSEVVVPLLVTVGV